MNRPLVSVVLAYTAGILLALKIPLPLLPLFASAAVILALILLFKKLRPALIWPLLVVAGWTNYTVHTAILSPQDLRATLGDQPALVTVRGQMLTSPQTTVQERDGQEKWHSLTPVQIQAIGPLGQTTNFLPATGQILVTTPGLLATNYFAGQTVAISGLLAPPQSPVAPGLFDYQSYLATHGTYYQLKAEATNDWQLLGPGETPLPWGERFLAWAHTTLALGLPEQDEPLELLWAMTLGWHPPLTGEICTPFMQTGTINHILFRGMV